MSPTILMNLTINCLILLHMNNQKNILVFGSNGMVGSSVSRKLKKSKKVNKLTLSSRSDTDLFNSSEVFEKINKVEPDVIINCAAKVGGILANNTYRTEFLIENLKINMNIVEGIRDNKNIKLINLGSSCIYPLNATNPIKEDSLLAGKLEPTNSPYALSKIVSIELANALSIQFGHKTLNLMPTNLYGVNDNFSEGNSHVIPGLIRRMYQSKLSNENEFKIWGSGKPLREFLYVDDLANAVEFFIDKDITESLLNIGSGVEISILDLAKKIQFILGYKGTLAFDNSKPDGNPRKLLDSSLANSYGWRAQTSLDQGLEETIEWYLKNIDNIRSI
jgi:GDP-L-fucose synthase